MEEVKKEGIEDVIADVNTLLKNCDSIFKEMDFTKKEIDFLINEWNTNKRYFREEPGKVTTEDVIRTVFNFAWASCRNYDYMNRQ